MPTNYTKAPDEVLSLSARLLKKFETHKPLLDAEVLIDFLMAFPPCNAEGEPAGRALKKNGRPCLGITRIVNLKDRAKGLGDAEVCLDGEEWKKMQEDQKEALLDHELHHISVNQNKQGIVKRDDLGRPKLRLRKHDEEFGWFRIIAARHGAASQEVIQALAIFDTCGQLYWPSIAALVGRNADQFEHALRPIRA